MSELNVGTLAASVELKDTLSPALVAVAASIQKGVSGLGGWSAAQQRAAMAMAGTHAEALKLNRDMDAQAVAAKAAADAVGKWTEADQKAAMSMAALHDEALKVNAAMATSGKGSAVAAAGLGEAEKAAAGLAGELGPAGAAMTAMGPAGLVAAAGLGALLLAGGALVSFLEASVSKAAAFGAQFQELSDNSDVAADKLQAIAGAAGIGMEGTQAFAGGLKNLNKELLAAGADQKFEQLGLSTQKLLAMEPEERFAAVARAITELDSDAERAAASQDLLGRSMPLATLKDFADIQEKMARSQSLGLVLDPATTAELKALNDEAKVLADTWAKLMVQFGAAIATTPGVKDGIIGLADALGEASQFIVENKQLIQDMVSLALPLFQKLSDGVSQYVDYLKEAAALGHRLGGADPRDVDPARVAAAQKAIADARRREAEQGKDLRQGPQGPTYVSDSERSRIKAERERERKEAEQLRERAAKETEQLKEKLDKQSLEMAESMDAAREKYEALWTSLAGMSTQQVTDELAKVAEIFQHQLKKGAEVSTEQLERLRQKMLELQKLSPEAFSKAFENNPQVAALMAATANLPSNFVKPGQGMSREGLEDTVAGNASKRLGNLALTKKEEDEATRELIGSLRAAADGLDTLGRKLGGVAGGILSLAGNAAGIVANVKQFQLSGGFGAMTGTQKVQGAASALGAAGQIWQQNRHNMSAGNAALSGAGAGAKEGAKYGGVAGAVIGGVLGAGIAVLSGAGFRKLAKESGRVLGVEMTKELAITIEATKKDLKVSTKSAALLNVSKAMEESGRGAGTFAPQIGELIKGIADKSIPATQGMEELGRAFSAVAEEASKSKVASQAMFSVMKQARDSKVMTDEMKQAISAAAEANAQLSSKVFGQMGKGASGREGAVGGLQILTPEQAEANARIFGLIWGETVAEKGLAEAARLMQPGFEALQDRLAQHGDGFSQAAAAIFAPIKQQFTLGQDELFAGAADSASALADILKNTINTAMPLTIEQFNAFGTTADQAFHQAEQAALSAGLTAAEASKQAAIATAPLLEQQMAAAEAYGFELDANTKQLVEQAKAAGVAFASSPVDRMAEGVDRMVVALEKLAGITPRVADGFRSIGSAAGSIQFGSHAGIAEGEYPGAGIPSFPHGGWHMPQRGGILRAADANEPEFIGSRSAIMREFGGMGGNSFSASFGDVIVQIPPGSSLNPEQVAAAVVIGLRDNLSGLADRVAS